ncbi:hypothetical protein Tco_1270371 [Tanacetum coccineum]
MALHRASAPRVGHGATASEAPHCWDRARPSQQPTLPNNEQISQLRVEKTKNFIELNLALVLVPNNAVIPKVAPKRKKSQHEEKYWLLYQHDHLHDSLI